MLRNQVVDTYRNMATMCYTFVSTTKHKKKKVGIVYLMMEMENFMCVLPQ